MESELGDGETELVFVGSVEPDPGEPAEFVQRFEGSGESRGARHPPTVHVDRVIDQHAVSLPLKDPIGHWIACNGPVQMPRPTHDVGSGWDG
ncbi:hypothetical protein GCM10009776_20000 [Microbacterium deminutum]|uniref:Uncharacterized protein n=1 Tax=Microbacterium deminutum TaxID=344164 RepID=A0ABN2QTA5_9MICO